MSRRDDDRKAHVDERYQKAFPVSWDQFHRDARALAWRLSDQGPFTAVVAVTRGGLVPAAIVARELEVLKSVDPALVTDDGAHVLIVDDLVDTGKTAAVAVTYQSVCQ